jgi:hypothetical protein
MFVQVIKAQTSDPDGLRRQAEQWREQVRPGAIGFLGTTAGITADGTFIAIARFTDEASARQNSNRPEQGEWWQGMAKFLTGEPSFRESTDVALLFDGGSDTAGFVQVMEGTAEDRAKAEAFETPEMLQQLRAARPDLIGGLRAWFGGSAYIEVAYFTSEAEARAGEASTEFSGPQQEYAGLFRQQAFLDLREPMLVTP